MTDTELKAFLNEKVELYNNPDFIESDPIQIPHAFSIKEDIEIAGFLSSIIAWGNRKMIINNSKKMMELMGNSPYDFIMTHQDYQLERLENFVHRTFNGQDFISFIKALQNIYANHSGLEAVFLKNQKGDSMQESIHEFKKIFFEIEHLQRTQKHISDPLNNSAAKRINMSMKVIKEVTLTLIITTFVYNRFFMEEVNFADYKKKLIAAGVSEDDIYDFRNDRIKSFYQRYFDWCVDNVDDYSKTFQVEPSYFYYWNTHKINAEAGLINGKYIIRFSKPYMEALHKKLGTKGQFFDKTNWTGFHHLQNILNDSLEFLMFQASTIFTFYHEFAHLVQMKGKVFKMSEHPTQGNFSFQNHVYEYDADLNGCQFVSMYIQQFYSELLTKE
ncbi:MAG: hypothetical protein DCE86_13165, partial [Flavobacteriaceae bacterium]